MELEELEMRRLTKISNSIVLVIRRKKQSRERNGGIQNHPRHPQPSPIRTPGNAHGPEDAEQIRRCA